MRVFVYEYLSSGVLPAGQMSSSMRVEGRAMLDALLRDFGRCDGVNATTLVDAEGMADEEKRFRALARAADWTLLVAPECGGILEDRCRWVEDAGGRLLGSSPAAVRLTADKLTLACHLQANKVPTPPTKTIASLISMRESSNTTYPIVVKPRDGAGSQATFLLRSPMDWNTCIKSTASEGWNGEFIVQPFVEGLPASVAFLMGQGGAIALPAAEQSLSADGRFRYGGGSVPLPSGLAARARQLAQRAVAGLPGLRGFVGVDLVLGATAADDVVVEINPRVTTSYVGLRQLARFNLAEALLALARGEPPPALSWRRGPIRWRADGTVLR